LITAAEEEGEEFAREGFWDWFWGVTGRIVVEGGMKGLFCDPEEDRVG
jgi:hypothetical protein